MTKANLSGARAAIAGFQDPRSFAIRQLLNWADELQASGKPLPQDNPGDRTEGERHAHAKHHYSERGLCWYCSCNAWSADDGVSWTESTQPLDVANRRISELEAQRASFETLFLDATRVAEAAGAERDSLREQLRLWEATRELLLSSSRAWLEEASNSQAISGGRHVLRACAEAVATALPPPVAPEPADPAGCAGSAGRRRAGADADSGAAHSTPLTQTQASSPLGAISRRRSHPKRRHT